MNRLTTAEAVAALFGDDGQKFWNDDDTVTIDEIMVQLGATVRSQFGFADDPIAYRFRDGSSIVIAGDCWAFEGDEPFTILEG